MHVYFLWRNAYLDILPIFQLFMISEYKYLIRHVILSIVECEILKRPTIITELSTHTVSYVELLYSFDGAQSLSYTLVKNSLQEFGSIFTDG